MTTPLPWASAADPHRRIGNTIEFHASIGSTNDRARSALSEPGGDGLAVVADLQTAGRGRHGRGWESPPGENLMVSVALRPALAARDAWQLGAAAALAACAACAPLADLRVKWPNDLFTADGLKVGGILVETALPGDRVAEAVIGLGLNVNWQRSRMPPEIAGGATSLADVVGGSVDRVALLGRYLAALDREVAGVERGESPVAAMRARSWLDGREVSVDLPDGAVAGRAAGIGDDGALLIETAAGLRRVHFGDAIHVQLPRVAA